MKLLLDFSIRMYNTKTYTINQLKSVILKYQLTEMMKTNYNIVQVVETEEIKFTTQDYKLQTGEKFLDEEEFFII